MGKIVGVTMVAASVRAWNKEAEISILFFHLFISALIKQIIYHRPNWLARVTKLIGPATSSRDKIWQKRSNLVLSLYNLYKVIKIEKDGDEDYQSLWRLKIE